MSTTPRIMPTTTMLEHQKSFFHCLSLIEKTEYNDGTGDICTMLQLNQINIILDILQLDNENMKEIHKIVPDRKTRAHTLVL